MDGLVPECAALKKRYDECISKWRCELTFSSALQGIMNGNGLGAQQCDPSFVDYRDCTEIVMKLKIQKKQANQAKENEKER